MGRSQARALMLKETKPPIYTRDCTGQRVFPDALP